MDTPNQDRQKDFFLKWAGATLIAGSVAFMAVFGYLAAAFGYPEQPAALPPPGNFALPLWLIATGVAMIRAPRDVLAP